MTGQGEPADDVPKVQAAMVGADCLDAGRFPTIRFVSTGVARAAVAGAERRRPRAARPADAARRDPAADAARPPRRSRATTLEATGRTTLRQTDFGITPISKAGVVKVKDEMTIVWRFRGIAR